MAKPKKGTIPPPRDGLIGEWGALIGPGAAPGPLSTLRRRRRRLRGG